MGRQSAYTQLLEPLLSLPSFSVAEATAVGIPRQALAYLVKQGVLERIARGYYRRAAYESDEDVAHEGLALTASTIPSGVICLISALDYYNLTEEIPRRYWITVPISQRPPVRPYTRIVRMHDTKVGLTRVRIAGIEVSIFDPERCIIDAFRYASEEVAIKALKVYLFDREIKPDLRKLHRYAKMFRVSLRPYVTALIT